MRHLQVGLALGLEGARGDGRQLRQVGAGVSIEVSQGSVLGCVGSLHFFQHALMRCLHCGRNLK